MRLVLQSLLGVLFIVLMNCEGRRTQHQALSKSIEEFKKTVNFEVDVYKPESYTERKVDTLLSNGYHVKIKAYTDMENMIRFSKIKDTINYQTYYRNYKFDISIEKEGQQIYNESFDKKRISSTIISENNYALKSNLKDFKELSVLKSIQLDEDPTLKNKVAIDILYAIPETDKHASFKLFIDEKGTANFVITE